ncbi:MAG: efflux RND transporter periplasmic adaptor subunit, partial [Gallionellaceae bacterium]|nr:efflux RND transporter periplasmic adaptor subunit [Gallionellaceae bacterium]
MLLAVLLISGFAWVIMTQGPLAPVKVTIEKIQTGTLSSEVFGVGLVEARHSYTVSPVMTGRISKLLVDQGDQVKAGQVVAELDPIDLNDKLGSSRLVAERAGHSIKIAEAQLVQAQSQGKTISASHKRYSELQAQGFVSQELLDAKLNEKTAALATLDAATASLAAAKRDQSKAQSDVAGINKLREQTRLISPVSGIVTARLVEQGAIVVPGQVVIQVIAPNDIWIKTRIDQKQAGMIRAGQKTAIVLRSHPQTSVSGVVERVDLTSDAVTEERIVNVAAPEIHASIGEYAEVTIKLPVLEKTRSIPTAAVKRINQQDGIWVLQNNHAKFKPVTIGISTLNGRTQILDGIADSDEVIVYSQQA